MTDTKTSQAEDDRTIADLLSEENLDAHRVSASIQAAIRLLLADRDKARAEIERQRDMNRMLARGNIRAMNRASSAEDALARLGDPEQQWGVAPPDGSVAFEFDSETNAWDHLAEYGPGWNVVTRTVYATRWKAAGGAITADMAPLLQSGCTMPMPSRRTLEQLAAEQGVQPVVDISELISPEPIPADEADAFLAAIRDARTGGNDD